MFLSSFYFTLLRGVAQVLKVKVQKVRGSLEEIV